MDHLLEKGIEALIFASEQRITVDEIHDIVQKTLNKSIAKSDVQDLVDAIQERYDHRDSAFALQQIDGGYLFMTKAAYYPFLQQLQVHRSKKKLSQAALETLAIVAYKQPVTKLEIEQIRGVNCDYSLQRLLEKDLISILGKSTSPGRPLLYGTSSAFMEYFGLNDISELPKLKDLAPGENSIGTIQD